MDRILGIDYGEKRVGLAISDPLGYTAQALGYVINDTNCITAIKQKVKEYDVQLIILGLPLNKDGEDSPKCKYVREFADSLKKDLSLDIKFWDERFSTVAVTRHLIEADVSRKKRKEVVDTQAAVFILQGYLDSIS